MIAWRRGSRLATAVRSAGSNRNHPPASLNSAACCRRGTPGGGGTRCQCLALARRALASGNLLASGSIAFLYAVVTLFRSGMFDEAVPIFNQAIAQARRRGTSSTSRSC